MFGTGVPSVSGMTSWVTLYRAVSTTSLKSVFPSTRMSHVPGAGFSKTQTSRLVGSSLRQSASVSVGRAPWRTARFALPRPPDMPTTHRFLPWGTSTLKYCTEPRAPLNATTFSPLASALTPSPGVVAKVVTRRAPAKDSVPRTATYQVPGCGWANSQLSSLLGWVDAQSYVVPGASPYFTYRSALPVPLLSITRKSLSPEGTSTFHTRSLVGEPANGCSSKPGVMSGGVEEVVARTMPSSAALLSTRTYHAPACGLSMTQDRPAGTSLYVQDVPLHVNRDVAGTAPYRTYSCDGAPPWKT